MLKIKIFFLLWSVLTFFKSNAGYLATPTSFSFTSNAASLCLSNTYTITNISIAMNSKTSVRLSFSFKFNSSGQTYNYNEIGTFSGSNISITFPRASFYAFCSSDIESRRTYFTPTLSGGTLGVTPINSTLGVTASGYSSGIGRVGVSLVFTNVITPQVTPQSLIVCSNTSFSTLLSLDSFTPVVIKFNGITVVTKQTDDVFSLSYEQVFILPSAYNVTDGGTYTLRVEYNNGVATEKTIKVYTPITNTNVVSASKPTSCYGEFVNLNVNVPSGVNFAWSDGYGVDKSPRPINDSKEYFITMSKSGGTCPIQSNKVSIQVIPNFTATVSPNRTQACEEQIIQISATPNDINQYNYVWSIGANSSSIFVSQNGNYNVTITPKTGDCAGKTSNTVNNLIFDKKITGENILLANNKTNAIFCKDEASIILSATANDLANVGYQWSGPKTGSAKDLIIENGGEYTVRLFRGACSVEKKISVIGKINLAVDVNPNDARICKDKEKAILLPNIRNIGDYTYQWFGGSDGKTDLKITTMDYSTADAGLYRVILNPKGGNCSVNGTYDATRQIFADNPITNFQITGRKANDIVPICNLLLGVNLEAISDDDVKISWNGGTPALKRNIISTNEDNKVFTAKFERGKCIETISLSTKRQELLASIKTPTDISKRYITCASNVDFKLIAESNFAAATIKWQDANNTSFSAIGKEFIPKTTGLYYAVANLPECGQNDSQGSSKVDITLIPDFRVNIASQYANPICDETTQTFTATPTYQAYSGSYSWTPNLSTTKTLQSKAEGNYTVTIQQDGCKATSITSISVKPSKPTITAIDNFILIASNDTKDIEWLFKELPLSNDPIVYKSFSPVQTSEQILASKVGAYVLKANRNGCGINYSAPFVISVINSNEYPVSNSWKVYPNPAISKITVENNTLDFSAQNTVELRNSTGTLVKYWIQNEYNKEYTLDNLSAGTYYLTFNQKNVRTVKKIIKL